MAEKWTTLAFSILHRVDALGDFASARHQARHRQRRRRRSASAARRPSAHPCSLGSFATSGHRRRGCSSCSGEISPGPGCRTLSRLPLPPRAMSIRPAPQRNWCRRAGSRRHFHISTVDGIEIDHADEQVVIWKQARLASFSRSGRARSACSPRTSFRNRPCRPQSPRGHWRSGLDRGKASASSPQQACRRPLSGAIETAAHQADIRWRILVARPSRCISSLYLRPRAARLRLHRLVCADRHVHVDTQRLDQLHGRASNCRRAFSQRRPGRGPQHCPATRSRPHAPDSW